MCRPDGRHVFLKGKVQMITYLRLTFTQNMAESLGNTTVSTTKAHGQNRDKCKRVGRNS